MRVAIRADASSALGAGHVMRCLALASGLQRGGATVTFVCRALAGHMGAAIESQGFACALLPVEGAARDAEATRAAIDASGGADWVVADHYETDARWDAAVRAAAPRLMVIDDLADRRRACDLLLNQNGADLAAAYRALVPAGCRVLAGPRYALLRQEFADARRAVSAPRAPESIANLVISMGGTDPGNVTAAVLEALRAAVLPSDTRIAVLLGSAAPWIDAVRNVAATLPWRVDVRVNAPSIADQLLNADLAIGAAGSSSWERCAAALPSIAIIIAGNQVAPARTLQEHGAAVVMGVAEIESDLAHTVSRLAADRGARARLSAAAAALVDAQGVDRVVQAMTEVQVPA